MLPETLLRLTRPQPARAPFHFEVPVTRYTCSEDAERERALVQNLPFVAATSASLEPGTALPHDVSGIPLLLTRDTSGQVRGFLNACRHRGARLCPENAGPLARLSCPYHGWSYGMDGASTGRPCAAAFTDDRTDNALVPVPVAEAHGQIWASARPGPPLDLDVWLGGLQPDLAWLLADHRVPYRTTTTRRHGNWKLLIEAFLESYHVPILHRASVGRFFTPFHSTLEAEGPHVRAMSARRSFEPGSTPTREDVTFSWVVFPGTVFIAHPGFTSRISVFPDGPGALWFQHSMLVPEGPQDAEHLARSHALIEDQVFQGEDLHIVEQIQQGFATGANEVSRFGALEHAIAHFHATLDEVMA